MLNPLHTLLIGKTGMGKSTLVRQMIAHDLDAGRGLLLLDPHGDLAEQVLLDVPRHRKNDLVVFDATHPEDCPGLNPLRGVIAASRPLVVSAILATLRKTWPDFWGPRLEHILRAALMATSEVRGATLADAQRMLIDEVHRHRVLKQVKDEVVLRFWGIEFPGYGKRLEADATAPVLNKLGALMGSPVVRAIVTKSRPRLDPRRAMDAGRVVVASLAKGQIGEDATTLLGSLLLGAFQHATMARAALPPDERRPFTMFVDEVASFATPTFIEMIAEARKYGVRLVLATQSLAAMEDRLRAALLGNVGELVCFRVGADDARIVAAEFGEELRPQQLMDLEVGEHVVRVGAGRPRFVAAA
jgi:DNA helicase HerA-like ATPase